MATERLGLNLLGTTVRDDSQVHAEATKSAQAAWDRAVAANERNDLEADERWEKAQKREEEGEQRGYVFAKSCALPDGVTDHTGFVPVESLKQYGSYAVLGTGSAISTGETVLRWIGGSGSAMELVKRVGGTLSTLAPPNVKIMVGMVLPNTTSPDSAFYTTEQYAELTEANTRVRVNVKYLPDGAVSMYGFYTGTKREWQHVPVIEAEAQGDQMVADLGDGIKIIWTPAADPNAVLGIPALEGITLKPAAWVFPPIEKAAQILINPVFYPPDYQDAIIWFPSQPTIAPIYLSINVLGGGDIKYYKPPKMLTAFPSAKPAKDKNFIQGGGGKRRRWKDGKGRIYEWDSQHGKVEIYNSQGTTYLGEFDPETGEQTKPAIPGRTTQK